MLKSEVRKGMFINPGYTTLGKAKVLSDPEPTRKGSRTFWVDIEHVDLPGYVNEIKRTDKVEIRRIEGEWTAKDEENFKKNVERSENERGWKEALAEKGFPGRVTYYPHDDSYMLYFEGLTAERVIEALTGETIPKKAIDVERI